MTLSGLIAELVDLVDVPEGTTWLEYSTSMVEGTESAMAARQADEAMVYACVSGERPARMRSAVALIAALEAKAVAFGEMLDNALNAPDHFHSLKTEVRFLHARADADARSVLEDLIRERVLKRHLWVASRKFRNQKAYTFLIEPEEGVLRFRGRFRVSPSSPRLEQAMRFLRDVKLIDDVGLTDLGRTELNAA